MTLFYTFYTAGVTMTLFYTFYTYLGIPISVKGAIPLVKDKLVDQLKGIQRAPLKPQQKLWFLNNRVVPSHLHSLILTRCTNGFLRHLDRLCRSAVKSWLKLPDCTPNAFFYANAKDGGLGLCNLEFTIPALKARRLAKLQSEEDPVVVAMTKSDSFKREVDRWTSPKAKRRGTLGPRLFEGYLMDTKDQRRHAWRESLYRTVDGCGLASSAEFEPVHRWVTSGTALLSGRMFRASVALRAGVLPSRARNARGRPEEPTECDACGRNETLAHILQVCARTKRARNDRHNKVLDVLHKEYVRLGFEVIREPRVKDKGSVYVPDMVVYKEGTYCKVLDATVVADNANLSREHEKKVAKYTLPGVSAYCASLAGVEPVYSAFVLNWRGALCSRSALDAKSDGIKVDTLILCAVVCMERGALIHKFFTDSTYRVNQVGRVRTARAAR